MAEGISAITTWFSALPGWAKIAAPVGAVGIVVLIWQPWKKKAATSAAIPVETSAANTPGAVPVGSPSGSGSGGGQANTSSFTNALTQMFNSQQQFEQGLAQSETQAQAAQTQALQGTLQGLSTSQQQANQALTQQLSQWEQSHIQQPTISPSPQTSTLTTVGPSVWQPGSVAAVQHLEGNVPVTNPGTVDQFGNVRNATYQLGNGLTVNLNPVSSYWQQRMASHAS